MTRIFLLGLIITAPLTLTNCKKEIDIPRETKGIPFTISLNTDTKTTNDGLATNWEAIDKLTVFRANAGTTNYGSNLIFSTNETDYTTGKFKGTIPQAEPLADNNDWYFLYPYSSFIKHPKNNLPNPTDNGYTYIGKRSDQAQVQSGYGSKAHLAGANFPLACKLTNVPKNNMPTGIMKQVASVVAIEVTNALDESLIITDVVFTGTESLVGQFYIDFTGDAPSFTDGQYVSNIATLSVTGGTALAKNQSATLYIGIKPFTATEGSILKLQVNTYEKEITLTKDVTFSAGSIKTLFFNYNKEASAHPTTQWTKVTSADQITAGGTFIIGYEADPTNAPNTIVPMRKDMCGAKLTANGILYSGTKSGTAISDNSTIQFSSTATSLTLDIDTTPYEVTISASTVSGAVDINVGEIDGGSGDKYIGLPSGSTNLNTVRLYSSKKDSTAFTPVLIAGTTEFKLTSGNRTLMYNSTYPRFATYTSTQKNLTLYKKVEAPAPATGWLEMPAYTDKSTYFLDTFKVGDARNYTYLYDKDMYTSMFVAYPLYSDAMGSHPRPTKWEPNPNLLESEQINVWTGSYGVSYGSTIYSRGHLIPNASRNGNTTMQDQTFYATNSVPQVQDKFNSGVWSSLEGALQTEAGKTDTLYIVTGVSFRKIGGTETITYITPQHDPDKQCPVPNYFWKVALKVKRSGGNITTAKTIGFWYENRQHENITFDNPIYIKSVDQIETWTGLDFFPNLLDKQTVAETNTDWEAFKSF